MEIQPTAALAAEQSHNEETWPFSSLPSSRPWPFEERAKPAISFEVQEKSDFSYMNGETDGEGGSLYGMAPMKSEPAEIERKPHESGNVVTVGVDSGASGHYFDDTIIPDLKHRLQNYISLSTLRTILTAGGALLDDTAESVLQGLMAHDYREQHVGRIAILFVAGIGRKYFLGKNSGEEEHRFDFRCQQTQVGGGQHYRATSRRKRRALLLQAIPQCGCIRRNGAGDECDDQCPSVALAAESP